MIYSKSILMREVAAMVAEELRGIDPHAEMIEDFRAELREARNIDGDPIEHWRDRKRGFHKSRRPTRAEISREVEKCYESGDPWNALPIGTFNRTYDD